MIPYREEGLFGAPRDSIWELLEAHLHDDTIPRIHPLVLGQRTVARGGTEITVERTINARGRPLRSTWKLTHRPPDFSRWEIVESQGPWERGSFIENEYLERGSQTMIRSHGELRISVLPFFLPQGMPIRRVLGTIESEDLAFLRR